MTGAKKILLVYKFDHPDVNSIRDALAEQYPQYPIEMLNIKRMVKARPLVFLVNIFYLIKEYPLAQLLGYWKVWRRFWATTYIHQQIHHMVAEHASRCNYIFTFQTHADFDASSPPLPNFIYTDTTNLGNLYTPSFQKEKLYSPAWRELERATYENAEVTFTRSSHIRRSLIEQYGISPQKTVIAYGGLQYAHP